MYPRYTISEVVEVSDGSYASNLTIRPLSYYYDETIECNGTGTGYNIEPASSNTTVDLDIRKKGVFNLATYSTVLSPYRAAISRFQL